MNLIKSLDLTSITLLYITPGVDVFWFDLTISEDSILNDNATMEDLNPLIWINFRKLESHGFFLTKDTCNLAFEKELKAMKSANQQIFENAYLGVEDYAEKLSRLKKNMRGVGEPIIFGESVENLWVTKFEVFFFSYRVV